MRILIRPAILWLIFMLFFSCQNDTARNNGGRQMSELSNTDFIYLKDNHFELRNEKFFPMMLNYIVSFRNVDNQFIFSPNIDYEEVGIFETNTKTDIGEQLRGHFRLIRELGFNSIRMCFDRINNDNGRYLYKADDKLYFIDTEHAKILEGLETAIRIAGEEDLRVMLLIKAPIDNAELVDFTIRILKKFKDDPVVFAYDFMNEPLYFDTDKQRKKEEVFRIVSGWRQLMEDYAPNQLFTIGFSEPIETFKWDPAMLPVDFVAFHTYHPLRVKSEIYWYSTYVGKPWMIGETSLPADNDSISYEEQTMFMRDLYKYVVDCGGAGFGWWDFQEGVHGNFEAKYTGILNHEGTTITKDGKYTIIGTVKPAANEILLFSEYAPKEKELPVNYYNMVGYKNYLIKGRILNKKTKQPIEGATIRGWTKSWIGMNTFSDKNGEFTLYSNDESVHFHIAAPNMDGSIFDEYLKYTPTSDIPYDRNNLPDQSLEYHSISYTPFLKDSAYNSVFDFDPEKFDKAIFVGEMKDIYLKPINCK